MIEIFDATICLSSNLSDGDSKVQADIPNAALCLGGCKIGLPNASHLYSTISAPVQSISPMMLPVDSLHIF